MPSKPWLGTTSSFIEAFPNVASIDFTIDDNPWGWYTVRGARPLRVTNASAAKNIACPNPRCTRGGFSFGDFLRNHTYDSTIIEIDETYPCNGDEGTAGGRRTGACCMNSFKVRGTIAYLSRNDEGA